jgi:hypothetical protein
VAEPLNVLASIAQIEAARNSTVVVLAASNLEMDLLPQLYGTLRAVGRVPRLDVLLYCRGGIVNAARRIALLLHASTHHLGLIVPFHCESAGTVLALAARELVAGPLAMFSPIDPLLQSDSTIDGAPPALSCQDVRMFGTMAKEWFGVDEHAAPERVLSILCENIFPSTLTSFYRATLEMQQIGEELLSLHMGTDREVVAAIVSKLLFGFHSHSYALTGEEMRGLGLPVANDESVEHAAWEIASELTRLLGSGVRASPEADWFDCAIITRERATFRRVSREERSRVWEARELR